MNCWLSIGQLQEGGRPSLEHSRSWTARTQPALQGALPALLGTQVVTGALALPKGRSSTHTTHGRSARVGAEPLQAQDAELRTACRAPALGKMWGRVGGTPECLIRGADLALSRWS